MKKVASKLFLSKGTEAVFRDFIASGKTVMRRRAIAAEIEKKQKKS